ncbi:MAG: DNA-directed RNA polymerase subunit omega [SAR324 cluster bacterium]|nr:DNA-directed RNA polymerase subunit omega [SAR324 cluster bacterium]
MSLDYLKFIEEHDCYEDYNIFEKVLMATERAKDIYHQEEATSESDEILKAKNKRKNLVHKPTYRAIQEINEGKIELHYRTKEEIVALTEEPEETKKISSNDQLSVEE